MNYFVSVVVISYNAKDDLKNCLSSLEKQTYPNLEIIVVNDASTDGTKEFLSGFKSNTLDKLIIVNNGSNLGVAGARNVGISHADGDIIAFTDADCITDPHWISELIQGYEDKNVVAVGGGIFSDRVTNVWELLHKGHDFIAKEEGYVTYIQGCNMSFDAATLKSFMFNDEIKYGYEETLLCDDLIQAGYNIYFRPQAIVNHRHRTTFCATAKQKYKRGLSSIWYRKKKNMLPMFKRHIILFLAILLIPFYLISNIIPYLILLLFLVFFISLLRDEMTYKKNNLVEVALTFPFLLIIEFFHFTGSIAGLIKFRVLRG